MKYGIINDEGKVIDLSESGGERPDGMWKCWNFTCGYEGTEQEFAKYSYKTLEEWKAGEGVKALENKDYICPKCMCGKEI